MKGFKSVSKDGAFEPKRATINSAGYDFYAHETVTIQPNQVAVIPTGVTTDGMEPDEVLILSLRSGTSINRPLIMANGVGVIDADYEQTGEDIGIILFNRSMSIPVTIDAGERIAQGVIYKFVTTDNEKKPTTKRISGKGHTGTK